MLSYIENHHILIRGSEIRDVLIGGIRCHCFRIWSRLMIYVRDLDPEFHPWLSGFVL